MTKQYISILKTNISSFEFRLKTLDETRNYLLDEIKHNDLMSQKYKKTQKYLNCVKHLLILVSTVTGYVSISPFASLVCVPVDITSATVEIKSLQKSKSISQLERKKQEIRKTSVVIRKRYVKYC